MLTAILREITKDKCIQIYTMNPSVDLSDSIIFGTILLKYLPISFFSIVDNDAKRPYLGSKRSNCQQQELCLA